MNTFAEVVSSIFSFSSFTGVTLILAMTLAVTLAMDAFAISIATGIQFRKPTFAHYSRMASAFGIFQAIMFLLGYLLAGAFLSFIATFAVYVAVFLLFGTGLKMAKDSFDENHEFRSDPSKGIILMALAFATSIDALLVGLAVRLLNQISFANALPTALVIGFVCAGLSILGIFIGSKLQRFEFLGKRAELFGGLILMLIALNTLYKSFS